MRSIYIDIVNDNAEIVDIVDDLQVFYNMLNCRCVEMPTIKIGDKYFTVICDEEALLKSNPMPSAFDSKYQPFLFGNILIVKTNHETGELVELSVDDCAYIVPLITPVIIQNNKTLHRYAYSVLTKCSW